MISVIIPTLNAEQGLVRSLSSLLDATMRGMVRECLVVDGGSTDMTLSIAEDAGCEILSVTGSRGSCLHAGARAAKGPWLLFLQADTAMEAGWDAEVLAFIRQGDDARAATFRFSLDHRSWAARRAELIYRIRNSVLAIPYGDQGLLVSKAQYERVGGFRDLRLMEDVEIASRLKRAGGVTNLAARAVTSAARYRQDFDARRPLRNLMLLTLYSLGVSPDRLGRLYR